MCVCVCVFVCMCVYQHCHVFPSLTRKVVPIVAVVYCMNCLKHLECFLYAVGQPCLLVIIDKQLDI